MIIYERLQVLWIQRVEAVVHTPDEAIRVEQYLGSLGYSHLGGYGEVLIFSKMTVVADSTIGDKIALDGRYTKKEVAC